MLQDWDATLKNPKKLRNRCEKGIPARVRGVVWKLLTNSTRELCLRRLNINYQELLTKDTKFSSIIKRDLDRTFPKNILLMQQEGRTTLFNVLKASAVYNTEVGYCQGMGFVTGLLLMYMGEEDAFWVLQQLADMYSMSGLWKDKMPHLKQCFFVMDKLLETHLPKIHKHLKDQKITGDLYITQWFVTVFLYNLPFSMVLRIWDVFLLEGFSFVYAIALSIFKIYEDKLITLPFEELFQFLQFNHQGHKKIMEEEETQLLHIANSLKEKVKKQVEGFEKDYVNQDFSKIL